MPIDLRRDFFVDNAEDFGLGLVFVAVIDFADDPSEVYRRVMIVQRCVMK